MKKKKKEELWFDPSRHQRATCFAMSNSTRQSREEAKAQNEVWLQRCGFCLRGRLLLAGVGMDFFFLRGDFALSWSANGGFYNGLAGFWEPSCNAEAILGGTEGENWRVRWC